MKFVRRAIPWLVWSALLAGITAMGVRNNPDAAFLSNPRSLSAPVTPRTAAPDAATKDCSGQSLAERSR